MKLWIHTYRYNRIRTGARTPAVALLAVLALLLFMPTLGMAQAQEFKEIRQELIEKQENTRAEIEEINDQINTYQERLVMAEERYDRLYRQYEDLKRLIALQDQKINKLETELAHIRDEIEITEKEIVNSETRLDRLIDNYKETLAYVYMHGRSSQLALILSANSFNQMLVRAYYLNKFDQHRQEQARRIRQTREELVETKARLEEAYEKNTSVHDEIQAEKEKLAEKKERQEKNVTLLRRDREQIEDRLAEARQQKQKLDRTLTELVVEEERVRKKIEARIQELEAERRRKLAAAKAIEDEAERAEAVARYSEPVTREEYITEETLSDIEQSFASKKGELEWPVNSSTISEHFGMKRHPVYGTLTENLGVEIVTKPKDIVRVVHPGYVVAVQPLPNYGDVVVVKHGKYITAYGNLSQVMVRKNSVLEAGDIIGLSGDQNSAKGETVFFMVREGNRNLNPEAWLADKKGV